MSNYYDRNPEQDEWEREHEHKLTWACPRCGYSYVSERFVNEALKCENCQVPTVCVGESYK